MEENFVVTKIKHVIFVGPDRYSEKKTSFRTQLYTHELIFHFSGQATVYFGDQVLETAPNTVRFLPRGNTTRYQVDRQAPGSCIDIFFESDHPIHPEAFCQNADSSLGTLFQRLFALWVSREPGAYFQCMGLLYEILGQLQHHPPHSRDPLTRIDPALDYIKAHFLSGDIIPEVLARSCGISYSYLQKLFVRRFGMSPKQYEIRLRMNCACDLLRTGQYTVAQVAEQCGYRDIYFFCRQFKSQIGISPGQFQKSAAALPHPPVKAP